MRILIFIATTTLAIACSSSKKTEGRSYDAVTVGNQTFQLKNDTLYSSKGLKIFKGQVLVIGNPAGNDGFYRSIIYKTAIVPSIWGQDKRYDHAIENHVNVKKSREGVKKLLLSGKSVTVKGIGLWKNSKPNFYLVSITSGDETFSCDIEFALSLGELSLQ